VQPGVLTHSLTHSQIEYAFVLMYVYSSSMYARARMQLLHAACSNNKRSSDRAAGEHALSTQLASNKTNIYIASAAFHPSTIYACMHRSSSVHPQTYHQTYRPPIHSIADAYMHACMLITSSYHTHARTHVHMQHV
jgi:hypothetical protein